MTHDRQLERLLDAWFADGPSSVADRVIDDVAARISHAPQRPAWRLLPRRFPSMPLIGRLAIVGVLLAIAIGGGAILIGSRLQSNVTTPSLPTEGPGTTPLPQLTSTFVSPIYGYSFRYPAAWFDDHPATKPWDSNPAPDPQAIDEVSPDGYASGFSVVAERLAPGQTDEQWFQGLIDSMVPNAIGITCVPPRSAWRPTTVGGVDAYTYDSPCSSHEIALVTKGRAYLFDFGAPDLAYSAQDEATFRAILDTVHFADHALIDAP